VFCPPERLGGPTVGLTTFWGSQELTTLTTHTGKPTSSSNPRLLPVLLTLSDFGESTICALRPSGMFESPAGCLTLWCFAESSENTLPQSPFGFSTWEVTAHSRMFTKGTFSGRTNAPFSYRTLTRNAVTIVNAIWGVQQ